MKEKLMKKFVAYLSLFIFILSLSFVLTSCDFSDISINNYEASITFNDAGDAIIYERYEYKYSGHYVAKYRDIVYDKYNKDNPITQSITDTASLLVDESTMVSVTIDGKKYENKSISENNYQKGYAYVGQSGQFDERNEMIACQIDSSNCKSLFVYVPEGFGKKTVFEYNYVIKGATTIYNDIASYNFKLFEYNEADVKNGKVTINFLNNSKKEDLKCFARGANKKGSISIVSDNQIIIEFDKVKADVALEIRALSSKDLYVNCSNNNKVDAYVYDDIISFEARQSQIDNFRILIAQILLGGSIFLLLLTIAMIIIVYFKYDKEYKSDLDILYLRELPDESLTPAEVSYLYYFGSINDETITATLLDLIRRKYLILSGTENINDEDNFVISIADNADLSSLKEHEKFLINWFINIIGDGHSVSFKEIEKYPKKESNAKKFMECSNKFSILCKTLGKQHDFIINNSYKAKAYLYIVVLTLFVIVTTFCSFALNLDTLIAFVISSICLVGYSVYVFTIKKRTKKGNEEYIKWKAFKKFLEDFSNFNDYTIPSIVIWEHYLVYATVFKIADKVMDQLQVKLYEFDKNNVNYNYYDATFLYFSYRRGMRRMFYFDVINRSLVNAKRTSMQTIASASSNRSGRGGFSGGSSFGGGGGGGFSR